MDFLYSIVQFHYTINQQINSTLFYVKLKVTEVNGERVLKCIGFHEDEFI